MRDLKKRPYSKDEKRVAKWWCDHGIGGGDDPIGSLIASHETLAAHRNRLMSQLNALLSPPRAKRGAGEKRSKDPATSRGDFNE